MDKVIELEAGKSAVGIKNVTMNEPFSGTFSRLSSYAWCTHSRGSSSIRAVAVLSCDEYRDKLPVFAGTSLDLEGR